MRTILGLFALALAPAAHAQVTPTPWFLGDYSESFDLAPGGFLPCHSVSTIGDVCATDMHTTGSWGFDCTIFPYNSSAKLAGNTGGIQTWTFNQPITQFGGYFSTNSGPGADVTFRFYDQYGTLIDTVVEPLNNCTWDWRGYTSGTPIGSIEVENSNFSGGFVMVDEVEVVETLIPDFDGDGYEIEDGDCDDTNPNVYPGAFELCDGLDNNCDGTIPPDELVDQDGDGFPSCDDCDDTDPATNPAGTEVCDGADNDCDGYIDPGELDSDGDGFNVCDGDCDDTEAARYPGNAEICDGLDNDCDGNIDLEEIDADGDGVPICDGDCSDGDADRYPGAEDIPGDGIDQDCDGADTPGSDTSDDLPDVKPGGCGCSSSGPGGAIAVLPVLLLLARRRG